jgi:hypothetical protein
VKGTKDAGDRQAALRGGVCHSRPRTDDHADGPHAVKRTMGTGFHLRRHGFHMRRGRQRVVHNQQPIVAPTCS